MYRLKISVRSDFSAIKFKTIARLISIYRVKVRIRGPVGLDLCLKLVPESMLRIGVDFCLMSWLGFCLEQCGS